MELRQMEHFLSVAEWNSFTVAAEKAYISQSALSRSIGDLEFELGVKLFIRSKTTVTLTSEGELLLPIAREMLTTKSRFHQCAKKLSSNGASTLRIGYFGYWEYTYLCEVVHEFSKRQLYSILSFKREHHGKLNYLLKKDTVDIALTFSSSSTGPINDDNIAWLPVAKFPLCAAVSETNWLASKERLSLKDLEHETQIIVSRENDSLFNGLVEHAFMQEGIIGNYYPASPQNTYDGLLLVVSGQGILIATQPISLTGIPGVKFIPLEDSPIVEFGFAYRKDIAPNVIRAFTEAIKAVPTPSFSKFSLQLT